MPFGCHLDAFWMPFWCLLDASGTSLEYFSWILVALETFVGLWAFGESPASFFNIFANNLKMCFPVLCWSRFTGYRGTFFLGCFLIIFGVCFRACFGMFCFDCGVFWRVPVVFFSVFVPRNLINYRFSKKLLKARQAQCFSKWGVLR